MAKENLPFIDIEKVIADKNRKLLRILPKFVIRYIKKIAHQDEINELIPNLQGLDGLEYIERGLELMDIKSKVYGLDNIPREGRFIFAGNHPLGGLDGLVLAHEVGKLYRNVRFVVNDILMNMKGPDSIFIPVNKHGRQNTEYARILEDAYDSDAQILNFPAGLCSRKIDGEILDLEWKKSFISKAVKHKRDIIPVYIEGRNSNFFYNLANWRKFFRIKANIEMFYLVDEMFKQQGQTITVHFGKPIPFQTFDKGKKPQQWVEYVRERAYALKK